MRWSLHFGINWRVSGIQDVSQQFHSKQNFIYSRCLSLQVHFFLFLPLGEEKPPFKKPPQTDPDYRWAQPYALTGWVDRERYRRGVGEVRVSWVTNYFLHLIILIIIIIIEDVEQVHSGWSNHNPWLVDPVSRPWGHHGEQSALKIRVDPGDPQSVPDWMGLVTSHPVMSFLDPAEVSEDVRFQNKDHRGAAGLVDGGGAKSHPLGWWQKHDCNFKHYDAQGKGTI